jgi:hypothetical protein
LCKTKKEREDMKIEEIKNLTLGDMKRVAKQLNINGYQRVSTKEGMLERINQRVEELGLTDIPELEEEPIELEVKQEPRKSIRNYPKVRCVIETREEGETDLFISVNDYHCLIQFGEEIEIPEPVYKMVKGLKTSKAVKDENGFSKLEEVNKYIVSKV